MKLVDSLIIRFMGFFIIGHFLRHLLLGLINQLVRSIHFLVISHVCVGEQVIGQVIPETGAPSHVNIAVTDLVLVVTMGSIIQIIIQIYYRYFNYTVIISNLIILFAFLSYLANEH